MFVHETDKTIFSTWTVETVCSNKNIKRPNEEIDQKELIDVQEEDIDDGIWTDCDWYNWSM